MQVHLINELTSSRSKLVPAIICIFSGKSKVSCSPPTPSKAVNEPSSSELTYLSSSLVHIRAERESSLILLRAYRLARRELSSVLSLLSSLASSIAWTFERRER